MKYEIKKNNGQFREENEAVEGRTLQQRDQEPEVLEVFDTLEEAREALKKYKGSVEHVRNVVPFYPVTEFYIEQNEYDENREWISGGDVWDFAEREE